MTTETQDALYTVAEELHRAGLCVIPLKPKSKVPLGPWGEYQSRRPDASERWEWFGEHPERNLAVVCGTVSGNGEGSTLVVLDFDDRESYATFAQSWPDVVRRTWVARTRRGYHVYLRVRGPVSTAKMMHGELKAEGGYVVAPPSIHPDGGAYAWARKEGAILTVDSLADVGLFPLTESPTAPPLPERIAAGQRNSLLTSVAGSMRRRGASPEAILAALLVENEKRCDPPLSEREVRAIAASVGQYAPGPADDTAVLPELNRFHTTDAGQGETIAYLYADKLRFDHTRKRWLVWDGARWNADLDGEPQRMAREAARLRLQATRDEPEGDHKKDLRKWAFGAEASYRVKCALEAASITAPLYTTSDKFDTDPWLLACANGVIDLRTGELRTARQDDMITLSTELVYNPQAEANRWYQFLDEVFNADEELISFIQRAVGYSLTGLTSEQCFFPCWGNGANGKSVFLQTLRLILGEYAESTPFSTFLDDGRRDSTNDVAALRSARVVTASEVAEGKSLNEARIKTLTGGDPVTARFLFAEYFTYTPQYKIWLAVNHKPNVRDMSEATWRRVRLIPFTAHFPPDKADPDLVQKLAAEASGILTWAISGCILWQTLGLGTAKAVRAATAQYRQEQDEIGQFVDECCVVQELARVRAGALYKVYREWCKAGGLEAVSQKSFGMTMKQKFDSTKERHTYYLGVALDQEPSDDAPVHQ